MNIPKFIEFKVDRDEYGGDGDSHIYVMGKDILKWLGGIIVLGLIIAFTAIPQYQEHGDKGILWTLLVWCFVGLVGFLITRYLILRR